LWGFFTVPFYEYRCEDCGHQFEALQKISDAPLKACPECGADALKKLVSASAFVLKGSGWYVTDFRDKQPRGKGEKPAEQTGKTTGDKTAGEAKSGESAAKSESSGGDKSQEKSTSSSSKDTKPAGKAASK
jgi:putative FmdB family regulatory protein